MTSFSSHFCNYDTQCFDKWKKVDIVLVVGRGWGGVGGGEEGLVAESDFKIFSFLEKWESAGKCANAYALCMQYMQYM